jgi:hypothetical protein
MQAQLEKIYDYRQLKYLEKTYMVSFNAIINDIENLSIDDYYESKSLIKLGMVLYVEIDEDDRYIFHICSFVTTFDARISVPRLSTKNVVEKILSVIENIRACFICSNHTSDPDMFGLCKRCYKETNIFQIYEIPPDREICVICQEANTTMSIPVCSNNHFLHLWCKRKNIKHGNTKCPSCKEPISHLKSSMI